MKTFFGLPPRYTSLGFISSLRNLLYCMYVGVPDLSQVLRWALSPKHLSPDCHGTGVCFNFILQLYYLPLYRLPPSFSTTIIMYHHHHHLPSFIIYHHHHPLAPSSLSIITSIFLLHLLPIIHHCHHRHPPSLSIITFIHPSIPFLLIRMILTVTMVIITANIYWAYLV